MTIPKRGRPSKKAKENNEFVLSLNPSTARNRHRFDESQPDEKKAFEAARNRDNVAISQAIRKLRETAEFKELGEEDQSRRITELKESIKAERYA